MIFDQQAPYFWLLLLIILPLEFALVRALRCGVFSSMRLCQWICDVGGGNAMIAADSEFARARALDAVKPASEAQSAGG